MPSFEEKKRKSDKEFESILDTLDPHIKQKFESELSHIFEDMEKGGNLGTALDKLIEECNELTELQSKLILLIKKHLDQEKYLDPKGVEGINIDEKKVARDIEELSRRLLRKFDEELDPNLGRISRKDRINILDLEAKKNIKRIMKNFAIYEVYKVMNPKRIAGETAKDNYKHNLIERGEKVASKYEGGRESDLKRYGPAEVARIKSQVAAFKKGGGMNRGGGIGF